jgi:hypothetical protein
MSSVHSIISFLCSIFTRFEAILNNLQRAECYVLADLHSVAPAYVIVRYPPLCQATNRFRRHIDVERMLAWVLATAQYAFRC